MERILTALPSGEISSERCIATTHRKAKNFLRAAKSAGAARSTMYAARERGRTVIHWLNPLAVVIGAGVMLQAWYRKRNEGDRQTRIILRRLNKQLNRKHRTP